MPLDPDELGILRFERQSWRGGGDKDRAIAETFGCTPIRYYQRLHVLLDKHDALAADPLLVNRLRRIRRSRLSYRRAEPPRA